MKTTPNTFKSTCCYCGVGCGVDVRKEENGRLSLEGDEDHQSSKGMLCSKGMNLHYTVMDQSDRLLFPQKRPLLRIGHLALFSVYDLYFKENFNPNSRNQILFEKGLFKIHLAGQLERLCRELAIVVFWKIKKR